MSFNICRGTLGRLAMFAAIQRATRRAVYSFAEPVLGVFFGARVARQPMTTNAIRTATKIPNCSMSTMLILRRPEWGGIKSCAGSLADLQSLVAPTGRIWRPRRCQSGFLLDLACGDSASGPVSYDQRGANNVQGNSLSHGCDVRAFIASACCRQEWRWRWSKRFLSYIDQSGLDAQRRDRCRPARRRVSQGGNLVIRQLGDVGCDAPCLFGRRVRREVADIEHRPHLRPVHRV